MYRESLRWVFYFIVMLSVDRLNVVTLSVAAPLIDSPQRRQSFSGIQTFTGSYKVSRKSIPRWKKKFLRNVFCASAQSRKRRRPFVPFAKLPIFVAKIIWVFTGAPSKQEMEGKVTGIETENWKTVTTSFHTNEWLCVCLCVCVCGCVCVWV